ncbi:DUF6953 family protein [Aeromonas caviae]
MATARDVAEWMFSHFQSSHYLYQETIVYKIKSQFGDEFVYKNKNGNLGINPAVLKEFRKLTDGIAVWERGSKAWRKLRINEQVKGRQVD